MSHSGRLLLCWRGFAPPTICNAGGKPGRLLSIARAHHIGEAVSPAVKRVGGGAAPCWSEDPLRRAVEVGGGSALTTSVPASGKNLYPQFPPPPLFFFLFPVFPSVLKFCWTQLEFLNHFDSFRFQFASGREGAPFLFFFIMLSEFAREGPYAQAL
uniref:Uncharacterized protein n=1 Tax=Arundo donax TaxID=35708 RepID=A0A0A9FRV2_ARUDO